MVTAAADRFGHTQVIAAVSDQGSLSMLSIFDSANLPRKGLTSLMRLSFELSTSAYILLPCESSKRNSLCPVLQTGQLVADTQSEVTQT